MRVCVVGLREHACAVHVRVSFYAFERTSARGSDAHQTARATAV